MPDSNNLGVLNYIANGGLVPGPGILGLLGATAPNVNDWGGAPPPTVINNTSVQPGATGLALWPDRIGGDPDYPDPPRPQPVLVQPAIPAPSLSTNPLYPSVNQLTNVLYNEDGSLRDIPGVTPPGQSLDDLRDAQANVALNRVDRQLNWDEHGNLTPTGGLAPDTILPPQMNAMYDQIRAGNSSAYNVWQSSLDAALTALSRTTPPSSGPGSAPYFNQRPDASTSDKSNNPAYPFNSTLGPYRNTDPHPDPKFTQNGQTYWSFFGGQP